jgi:hypothetical protein
MLPSRNKQRLAAVKSYRELRLKIQMHYNTIKKYLTKIGEYRKAKKSATKTTARQQAVIKGRLKLLKQNFFSVKSTCNCVMNDESYFTVEGSEWHQKKLL